MASTASRARPLVLLLLAASIAAGCLSAPAQDTRVVVFGVLDSPAWERHEAARAPAHDGEGRALSHEGATASVNGEPAPPAHEGPTWAPGDVETLRWGVRTTSSTPMPGFALALEVPEGWTVVEGPTTWSGDVPPGGVLLRTTLRAEEPGAWWVPLRVSENGHPHHLSVQGRTFFVRDA